MNNIDINSIMEEIRNEIEEKGYTKEMLSFDDKFDQYFYINTSNINKSDDEKIIEKLNIMKQQLNIETHKNLSGNKFVVLIKKIIRKFTKFYIKPIVEEQIAINNSIIEIIEIINKKIDRLEIK